MSKFKFDDLAKDMQKALSGIKSVNVGLGNQLGSISDDPSEFVVMPPWWKDAYGVMGLQFGRIVQIAGDSDSGKSTLCMQAIKAAQEQGYAILYTETEGKTPVEYFMNWEIDPEGVMLVQSKIVEEAFDASFLYMEQFFRKYPTEKLLWVFDSYGNTVSMSDAEGLMANNQRVGGAAKTNRRALNKLVAKMQEHAVACLIVNYTYDNIGGHGKTNAGGKALNFFATLTIQSTRAGWIQGTVKGEKVRKGAKVKWTTFKNHYEQGLRNKDGKKIVLPPSIELSITDEGLLPAKGGKGDEE